MLGNVKPFELLLILLVVVLLFGAKKLPDMARSLGKSARILKSEAKAMKGDDPTRSDADPRGRNLVDSGAYSGVHRCTLRSQPARRPDTCPNAGHPQTDGPTPPR